MRKIASPIELHRELRTILAAAQQPAPSRVALAAQLRSLARRVAADEDESDSEVDLPVKRGAWTLWILKYSATRWRYSLHNPHGGSAGSGSYTNPKSAFTAATSRVNWGGADRLYLVVAKWAGDSYIVTRQGWVDIPGDGFVPGAIPMLKSAADV